MADDESKQTTAAGSDAEPSDEERADASASEASAELGPSRTVEVDAVQIVAVGAADLTPPPLPDDGLSDAADDVEEHVEPPTDRERASTSTTVKLDLGAAHADAAGEASDSSTPTPKPAGDAWAAQREFGVLPTFAGKLPDESGLSRPDPDDHTDGAHAEADTDTDTDTDTDNIVAVAETDTDTSADTDADAGQHSPLLRRKHGSPRWHRLHYREGLLVHHLANARTVEDLADVSGMPLAVVADLVAALVERNEVSES